MPSDKPLPAHKHRNDHKAYHKTRGQTSRGKAIQKFTKLTVQFCIIYLLFDILVLHHKGHGGRGRRNVMTFDHSSEIYRQEEDEVTDQCSTYPIITEEDVRQVITTAQRDTKPKYDTRRNKYLIPFSMQGQLGQLRGLREAIYLAIKLDRTLVLPPYFNDPWIDFEEGAYQKLDKRLTPDIDYSNTNRNFTAEYTGEEEYDENSDDDDADPFSHLSTCLNDNCTEFHPDAEGERLAYKVTFEAFDDDDFEAGLAWSQELFRPGENILPISAVIDIELLSTLLPVITTTEMKDECYGAMDVMYWRGSLQKMSSGASPGSDANSCLGVAKNRSCGHFLPILVEPTTVMALKPCVWSNLSS